MSVNNRRPDKYDSKSSDTSSGGLCQRPKLDAIRRRLLLAEKGAFNDAIRKRILSEEVVQARLQTIDEQLLNLEDE